MIRRMAHPKSRRLPAVLFGLFPVLLCAAGCQAPPQPDGPAVMTMRVADRDAFIDETLTILRELDFPPDRVDRAAGSIVAGPSTSGQWFEVWRRDVHGGYQVLESSLHTIQREVVIEIEPAAEGVETAQSGEVAAGGQAATTNEAANAPGGDALGGDENVVTESGGLAAGGGEYRVTVAVNKSRYAAPDRQVATASGALAIYNERLPTNEGLRNARSRLGHWVPLGRDALLEADLLDRIASRAAMARPAEPIIERPGGEEPAAAEPIEELPRTEP